MSRTHRIIVALGDSTTAGTPAFQSPLEAPPEGNGNPESQFAYWLMQAHPYWRVLNRGINGQRSDEIRARFHRDVLGAAADVLIIIAGVNDIYQGRRADAVQAELRQMYDLARDARIPVVAGSIIPFNTATADQNAQMHAVNAWIRNQAAVDSNLTYCDTRAAVASPLDPDVLVSSPDELHPSVEGYRLMADALAPAVERAFRK